MSILEFLINMQHVYLILTDSSFLHTLIRNSSFLIFKNFSFLPNFSLLHIHDFKEFNKWLVLFGRMQQFLALFSPLKLLVYYILSQLRSLSKSKHFITLLSYCLWNVQTQNVLLVHKLCNLCTVKSHYQQAPQKILHVSY